VEDFNSPFVHPDCHLHIYRRNGVSVVRATIMALTFLVAILLGKVRDLYNTLALAALIILVISPPSLFDISFQLPFMAVGAILFMTPKLTLWFRNADPEQHSDTKGLPEGFFTIRYCSLSYPSARPSGTMPLVVFYFNRVSAISLLANLIVVPIMGVIALPVCHGDHSGCSFLFGISHSAH